MSEQVPQKDPREHRIPIYIIRVILVAFFKTFYGIRWRYSERVPMTGPVILVPNHCCYYDPLMIALPIWRYWKHFTRSTYFKFPLGPIIRYLGSFPADVDRRFDRKAYEFARRELEQGGSVVIFPEGTRSPDGLLGKLQAGAAMLAVDTGALIVPITICGSFEAWPRHRKFPRFCRLISIKYHKPIHVEKIDDREARRRRIREIMAELERVLAPRLRAWRRLREKHGVRFPPPGSEA